MRILCAFLASAFAHGYYHCQKETGGNCKVFGCKSWRGPTQCINGECVCGSGSCATAGKCYSPCDKDTGGSCKVFGCGSSRGATSCVDGRCVCQGHHCAEEGTCKRKVHEDYHCQKDTGGSCKLFGCKSWRGVTQCIDGECVCPHHSCATAGVCYRHCDRDTGGSCKVFGCGSSRGDTSCVDGRCVCQGHHCAEDGKCKHTLEPVLDLVGLNSTTSADAVLAEAPEPTQPDTAFPSSTGLMAFVAATTATAALAVLFGRRSRTVTVPDSLLG